MRLETSLFEAGPHDDGYERMARVLEYSARLHSPETPLTVRRITSADDDIVAAGEGRKSRYLDNTRKTRHHCAAVQAAENGELLCLIDADTMVLGDLTPVESYDFDLAYTLRPDHAQYAFNSGVVFIRISEKIKEFYRRWEAVVFQMLADKSFHDQYQPRYGGVNQSGLAHLLEQSDEIKTKTLPCRVWNCEQDSWPLFGSDTKVVHILGVLRRECLYGEPSCERFTYPLSKKWCDYERAANALARRSRSTP